MPTRARRGQHHLDRNCAVYNHHNKQGMNECLRLYFSLSRTKKGGRETNQASTSISSAVC